MTCGEFSFVFTQINRVAPTVGANQQITLRARNRVITRYVPGCVSAIC